jgi:16S rRNA (uracil1498-N3)-methyltransferase
VERWRKIAISASEQSGRDKIPSISEPVEFNTFLEGIAGSHPFDKGGMGGFFGIIFSEDHKERNLREVLKEHQGSHTVTLLVGPEGGFSDDEVRSATENGFIKASLGPRILRTETAPIAALSIIQYELGDMG